MLRSLDSPVGRRAIEKFEKAVGVRVLFPVGFGGRDVETRAKPLRTPADIKGLKIRVIPSPVSLATMRAWGANPTPVDWAQTFMALQQGTVDGTDNPLVIILGAKMYEVVKYGIRLNYASSATFLFINANRFASLAPAHQKLVVEAAEEAKAWHWQDLRTRTERALDELRAKGMQIHIPTPEEYAQWASIREKVWQEVAAQEKGRIDLGVARELTDAR